VADLSQTRRRLWLGLLVLFILDLGCVAVLLSPIARASATRRAELLRLRSELQNKIRETAPLRGIDHKVAEASKQIAGFYEGRLPSSYSAITENLGQRAGAEKIKVNTVRYRGEDSDIPGLERVRIDANIEGDYLQEVKFINALERDKMFFLITSVNLGEAQGGKVRLDLQLETYRKTGT
jgi:type IV pilus assembly protein PilO